MGVITPFADAASPIYANSGYLPAKDYLAPRDDFRSDLSRLVPGNWRALGIAALGKINFKECVNHEC